MGITIMITLSDLEPVKQLKCTGPPCNDCKQPVGLEYWYMLHKALWTYVAPENGFLCVTCLECRLGRQLTYFDFDWSVPCNHVRTTPLLETRRVSLDYHILFKTVWYTDHNDT